MQGRAAGDSLSLEPKRRANPEAPPSDARGRDPQQNGDLRPVSLFRSDAGNSPCEVITFRQCGVVDGITLASNGVDLASMNGLTIHGRTKMTGDEQGDVDSTESHVMSALLETLSAVDERIKSDDDRLLIASAVFRAIERGDIQRVSIEY
jgi:hypothetical protein